MVGEAAVGVWPPIRDTCGHNSGASAMLLTMVLVELVVVMLLVLELLLVMVEVW